LCFSQPLFFYLISLRIVTYLKEHKTHKCLLPQYFRKDLDDRFLSHKKISGCQLQQAILEQESDTKGREGKAKDGGKNKSSIYNIFENKK
jgi:hypothetical protein